MTSQKVTACLELHQSRIRDLFRHLTRDGKPGYLPAVYAAVFIVTLILSAPRELTEKMAVGSNWMVDIRHAHDRETPLCVMTGFGCARPTAAQKQGNADMKSALR